jgi:GTP cyclohydrolase I
LCSLGLELWGAQGEKMQLTVKSASAAEEQDSRMESIKGAVRTLLTGVGEDVSREGLVDTPKVLLKPRLATSFLACQLIFMCLSCKHTNCKVEVALFAAIFTRHIHTHTHTHTHTHAYSRVIIYALGNKDYAFTADFMGL